MTAITVNFNAIIELNQTQFTQLCQENPELKVERNSQGELIFMAPTGGETGRKNASAIMQLGMWNEKMGLGEVFDSSTGFILPNGANRSPDVSWIKKERWESLSPQEKERFIPLCPDFVIEILSPTDNLKKTQGKMLEYQDNSCSLGWLINCQKQEVEIYRINQEVEILKKPELLLGENVLVDFTLNLKKIW
jgi:Uma2 family endonuclease